MLGATGGLGFGFSFAGAGSVCGACFGLALLLFEGWGCFGLCGGCFSGGVPFCFGVLGAAVSKARVVAPEACIPSAVLEKILTASEAPAAILAPHHIPHHMIFTYGSGLACQWDIAAKVLAPNSCSEEGL